MTSAIEHIINNTRPLPDKLTVVSKTSTVFDKAKEIELMTARPLDMKPYSGLIGVDLLSIAKDNNDNLWVGGNSPFGFLQIYSPLRKESISSFDFQLTAIHNHDYN